MERCPIRNYVSVPMVPAPGATLSELETNARRRVLRPQTGPGVALPAAARSRGALAEELEVARRVRVRARHVQHPQSRECLDEHAAQGDGTS
eukprot:gene11455-biopygen15419